MLARNVVVSGAFDNIRARDLRFLEESSKLGNLSVFPWSDESILAATGKPPAFPLAERSYFLKAVRYVDQVVADETVGPHHPVPASSPGSIWIEHEGHASEETSRLAAERGLEYHVIGNRQLEGFPEPPAMPGEPAEKKVVATGCFDWFHSGHVRFTQEASAYGDLYLCVGSDANIALLKGEGHPLLSQEERRYVVGSIKFVKQALITTGSGWTDADPEIRRIKPDIYVVNDDGDKGGKREYCRELGIEYLVLKRQPAPGLPPRSSTDLRGF